MQVHDRNRIVRLPWYLSLVAFMVATCVLTAPPVSATGIWGGDGSFNSPRYFKHAATTNDDG